MFISEVFLYILLFHNLKGLVILFIINKIKNFKNQCQKREDHLCLILERNLLIY